MIHRLIDIQDCGSDCVRIALPWAVMHMQSWFVSGQRLQACRMNLSDDRLQALWG
jgi:hypothetical protein